MRRAIRSKTEKGEVMRTAKRLALVFGFAVPCVLLGWALNATHSRAAENAKTVPDDDRGTLSTAAADDPPVLPPELWEDFFKQRSSLVQLLAHPDHYHGKMVIVRGFLIVEREGNAIYLSESDGQHMITCNAFWVSFENNALQLSYQEIAKRFSEKYVILKGTFDKESHGHWRMFQGAFKDVTRISVIPDRSQVQQFLDRAKGACSDEGTGTDVLGTREEGSEPPLARPDSAELASRERFLERFPSLVQIIADPDRYDGKTVVVCGFLRVEFEGDALYVSESDDRYYISRNGFWVSFKDNAMRMSRDEIAKTFSGKCVRLEARFDKNDRGHMNLFQGAFENITRLHLVPDRAQVDEDRKRRSARASSREAAEERKRSEPEQPRGKDPFAP